MNTARSKDDIELRAIAREESSFGETHDTYSRTKTREESPTFFV